MPIQTFHAKHEHGGHPVIVHSYEPIRIEVRYPERPITFNSFRQLLIALYNHGDTSPSARDPKIPFERYFKSIPQEEEVSIFSFFGGPEVKKAILPKRVKRVVRVHTKQRVATKSNAPSTLDLFAAVQDNLTVMPRRKALCTSPVSVDTTPSQYGIDLAKRGHEVKKLLYSGFGARIHKSGLDPDDVLQDVFRGILARNKGICPFDPQKSSFGHYVHMVCGCILSNYSRKVNRQRSVEQIGLYGVGSDDFGGQVDAALQATAQMDQSNVELYSSESRVLASLQEALVGIPDEDLGKQCLPLLYQGFQRTEIAQALGVDPSKVAKVMQHIRARTRDWALAEGL